MVWGWWGQAAEAAEQEIFYTDKAQGRDREYISLGCDHEPVLAGRTPLQVYGDFVREFASTCAKEGLWGMICHAPRPYLNMCLLRCQLHPCDCQYELTYICNKCYTNILFTV